MSAMHREEMSSNYPHYAPLGSSLPNDYAIVSHFATNANDTSAIDDSDNEDNGTQGDSTTPRGSPRIGRRSLRHVQSRESTLTGAGYGSTQHSTALSASPDNRRRSFGAYLTVGDALRRPSFGENGGHTTANKPAHAGSSWRTPEEQPLLSDLPLIIEAADEDNDKEEPESWNTWSQELKIISRYTAPVFG